MNIEPTGDLLNIRKGQDTTVVIANEAMKVKVEGAFRQRERKLFVLLVHNAWNELRNEVRHTIKVKDVKRIFKEIAGVKSFDNWLWDYLNTLADVKVTYSGFRLKGIFRLLSSVQVDEAKQVITYQFPEDLKDVLLKPEQFARLNTHFIIGLRGKYSVSLYQLLEAKINLKKVHETGYIDVPIEEIREWIGLDNKYQKWDHFKSRALEPAVEEINSNPVASSFTVRAEPLRQGKAVHSIRFFLSKTIERIEREKTLKVVEPEKVGEVVSLLKLSQITPQNQVISYFQEVFQVTDATKSSYAQAEQLQEQYPLDTIKSFINYAYKEAEKTFYKPATLSGIIKYLNGYLEAATNETQKREQEAQRSLDVRWEERRSKHEENYREVYYAFIEKRLGELMLTHTEAITKFSSWQKLERKTLEDISIISIREVALRQFDTRDSTICRVVSFFKEHYPDSAIPDFWEWDGSHNPNQLGSREKLLKRAENT